jgi:hypothetical protein
VTASNSDPADRPRRKPGNAFRAVGDEGGLVVLPERNQVKVLNPLGSRIYALLDGSHTRHEIVAIIVEEFEVAEEQAEEDLAVYLRDLRAEGMLAEDDDTAERGTQ